MTMITAGTMKPSPPTIAPAAPATRYAHRIASWVDAGPGSRLQAAFASSNDPRLDPATAADRQIAQQRDVCRRSAEAGQSDPQPLARDGRERDVRGRFACGVGRLARRTWCRVDAG